jgi:hypothetical protein
MPRKQPKPVHEMTSDELAKHVFSPKVQRHLKRLANPPENPAPEKSRSRSQTKDIP